ncbi:hypothetical protein FJ981_27915 [Mesorhizobium sp. B1-1-4]|nr:hypothetical protein FJ981_27915 [Mesorhizobium sp. B1-1-4]
MNRSLRDPFNVSAYSLLLRFDIPASAGFCRVDRATGAAVLRKYRRDVAFEKRIAQLAELRRLSPLGTARRDLKMGRVHA